MSTVSIDVIRHYYQKKGIFLDIVVYDSDGGIVRTDTTAEPELRYTNLHGGHWDDQIYIKQIDRPEGKINLEQLQNESFSCEPSDILEKDLGYFELIVQPESDHMEDAALLQHYIQFIDEKIKEKKGRSS